MELDLWLRIAEYGFVRGNDFLQDSFCFLYVVFVSDTEHQIDAPCALRSDVCDD